MMYSEKKDQLPKFQPFFQDLAVRRCLVKKMFLPEACNFIKKGILAQLLPYAFCGISKSILIHRTPPVAAAGSP